MSFTPQLFNFSKLFMAYSDIINKKIQVDDEIEAMSLLNYSTKIIKASVGNIKLTYQDDLEVIKLLMNNK
jgi:2-C-methyl-D-erythritol 4-phosphate cytidylyltransferase